MSAMRFLLQNPNSKKMSKFCLTSISIFIILSVSADPSFGDGDAGQAGEFLWYGVGARALGMGRAFTAVADDASAMYWNPGGMIALSDEGHNVMLMGTKLYGETSFWYGGAAFALDKLWPEEEHGWKREVHRWVHRWYLGLGCVRLSSEDFEERDENNIVGEIFKDSQLAFILAFTRLTKIGRQKFGIGLNTKYIQHKLFGESGSAWGFDVGLKYVPSFDWFNLGFIAQNINEPNIKIGHGGDDIIPLTGRIGLCILPNTEKDYFDAALLSLDYDVITPNKRKGDWHLGVEYDLSQLSLGRIPFKFRFGYNTSNENVCFGVSLDLPQNLLYPDYNEWLPRIDWAMSLNEEDALGEITERCSLDYSWGAKTDKDYYEEGKTLYNKRIEKYKSKR